MKYVLQVVRESGRICNLFPENVLLGKEDMRGRLECLFIDETQLPTECQRLRLVLTATEDSSGATPELIRANMLKHKYRWNKNSKKFERIAARGDWKRKD